MRFIHVDSQPAIRLRSEAALGESQRIDSGHIGQVVEVPVRADQAGNAVVSHGRRVDGIARLQAGSAVRVVQVDREANVRLADSYDGHRVGEYVTTELDALFRQSDGTIAVEHLLH